MFGSKTFNRVITDFDSGIPANWHLVGLSEPTAPAWARSTSAELATTDARRLALAARLVAAFESLAELGPPGLSVAVWVRDPDSGVADAILAIRMAKLDDGMDSAAYLVGLKEDEGRAARRAVPGCPDLDDSDRGRPRCWRLRSHHAYGIRCRSYRRQGGQGGHGGQVVSPFQEDRIRDQEGRHGGPLDAVRGIPPDDNGHSVSHERVLQYRPWPRADGRGGTALPGGMPASRSAELSRSWVLSGRVIPRTSAPAQARHPPALARRGAGAVGHPARPSGLVRRMAWLVRRCPRRVLDTQGLIRVRRGRLRWHDPGVDPQGSLQLWLAFISAGALGTLPASTGLRRGPAATTPPGASLASTRFG